MRTVDEIIKDMNVRFESANSVPVERAHIRRDEWESLRAEYLNFRVLLVDAVLLFNTPTARPEIIRAWLKMAGEALYPT